jgi:hypothetical protein
MKENKSDDQLQMRVENELKQLNLEMKYGAKFHTSGKLPPEIESQWLDNIAKFEEKFEEKFENHAETTLYNFIGQPAFTPIEQLSPQKMEAELERLLGIMEENGVHLAVLDDETPVKAVYRFITEVFFNQPISDFRIAGMIQHFIYEEFCPNHKYQLKQDVDHFFRRIMNLKSDFKSYFLSPMMATEKDSEVVEPKVYEKRIERFRNGYKKLKINQLEILDVDIQGTDEEAKFAGVVFQLDYEGVEKATQKRVQIKGRGYLNFVYADSWLISRIVFPGFDE